MSQLLVEQSVRAANGRIDRFCSLEWAADGPGPLYQNGYAETVERPLSLPFWLIIQGGGYLFCGISGPVGWRPGRTGTTLRLCWRPLADVDQTAVELRNLMTWQGIAGQDEVVERFRRAVGRGRVANSYLLVGPPGVGKRLFAEKMGQVLLCPSCDPAALSPCEACRSCQLMQAGNHPDWDYISRPEGKKTIPVEFFIGDRQHRGREGLCHRLAMKPFLGGRRIGVIDDADHLSEEDANCLLKTLEEPPPGSVLMLIGTSPDRQLPTIRSRCQLIRFRPLSDKTLADLLVATGKVEDREAADRLARCSGGSLQRAVNLSNADVWQFREDFLARMAERPMDTLRLAKAIAAFCDAAGKEAAMKRQRAAMAVEWAIELFSALLRMSAGESNAAHLADDNLGTAVTALAEHQRDNEQAIIACIDRCYAALDHIQRNAHLAIVTECWLDDLARLAADN